MAEQPGGGFVSIPGRAVALPWAVILLTACSLVAGCSASAAPSAGPSPVRHLVCTEAAGNCSAETMQAKPRVMYLSGDGTLYVVGITWSHWGTSTATGKGTAKADNCQPNCAQGTRHPYPATIIASDPKAWHRLLAYARVHVNIPAARYSYTFTRGLIPGPAPSINPPAPQASRSPSATPLLSSTCTLGFDYNGTLEPNTAADWKKYYSYAAEKVTFTNVGKVGVTLGGFETQTTWRGEVVNTHQIYGSQAPNLPEFLTPGQPYTAVIDFSSLSNQVTVSGSTYLDSKCNVVTWYRS